MGEAAKKKGRGTADAAQEALKALEARRRTEKTVADEMGLTGDGMARRSERSKGDGKGGTTLNSSAHQVKASNRVRKHRNWQGVQRSDEEARKVVEKALGSSAVGGASSSAAPAKPDVSQEKEKRSRSPRRRSRSCSWSLSVSRSGSNSPAREDAEDAGKEVVVDFF